MELDDHPVSTQHGLPIRPADAPHAAAGPSTQPAAAQPALAQPQDQAARPARRRRQRAPRAHIRRDDPIADTDEEDEVSGSQGSFQDDYSTDDDGAELDQQGMQTGSPDALYDPDADDEDERYVQQQRQGRTSDAILSCPGCFTTLCVDCQQHALFKNQYRAMFVMNCAVDTNKTVNCGTTSRPTAGQKRGRGDEDGQQPGSSTSEQGTFHPVFCEVCGADVGVLEPEDGLYTFYNVCPSNA